MRNHPVSKGVSTREPVGEPGTWFADRRGTILNRFVLDCSVCHAGCFEDEVTPYSDRVLDSLATSMVTVPAVWALEVANVLTLSERRGRITVSKSAKFLAFLTDLPSQIDERSMRSVFPEILRLARSWRLTAYDAAYLEVALHEGIPIATRDTALRKAAARAGLPEFSA